MNKTFNFPVLVLRDCSVTVMLPKREPIFCFKDDAGNLTDGRYADWVQRCYTERLNNQRPVSAKERAESTVAEPMEDKQPQ